MLNSDFESGFDRDIEIGFDRDFEIGFDRDLCKVNLWYELNPRVCCALGNGLNNFPPKPEKVWKQISKN